MKLDVKFTELTNSFETVFGEVHNISDGGYERGYAEGETKGYKKGYTEGEVKGFEDGAKSEHDRFWDAFQNYGNRRDYDSAFINWNDETFKPKYDIIVKGWGSSLFRKSSITDLKGILEKQGVRLDTSENQALIQSFQDSSITHIPEINATKSTNNNYLFSTGSILTIDKFIVVETTPYTSTTFLCSNLESVIFEGVIGQNGLSVSRCTKLNHESLMSIINALKSGVSGLTCTLGTTNLAKLTDAEKAIATEKGWTLA